MSYIYKGETGWIKQPNRVVQTFRSGLCMIQQQYIRRADDRIDYFAFREGDAIPTDDSAPCIDGAYIFPAPSYQDMGNGFISCTVTAYGRVNTTGVVDLNKRLGNYISTFSYSLFSGAFGSSSASSQKFFDVAVYRFAARRGEFITASDSPTLYIYDLDGSPLPVGVTRTDAGSVGITQANDPAQTYYLQSFTIETYTLGRQIEQYESTNYGEFLEVIISVTATGNFKQDTAYGPSAPA